MSVAREFLQLIIILGSDTLAMLYRLVIHLLHQTVLTYGVALLLVVKSCDPRINRRQAKEIVLSDHYRPYGHRGGTIITYMVVMAHHNYWK